MFTQRAFNFDAKSQQILVVLSALTLFFSAVAFWGKSEWLNSFAILSGTLMTTTGFIIAAPYCCRRLQIGKLLFVLGVIMTFWLGAYRCMVDGFVPRSDFIYGELSGHWRPQTVALAIFYIALFQCLGLVGYHHGFVPIRFQRFIFRQDRESPFPHAIVACSLIVLMFYVLTLRYGGTIGGLIDGLVRSRAAWGEREEVGLLMNCVWLGYYGIALMIVTLVTQKRQEPNKLLLLPLPFIGIVVVCMDGTRHHLLYTVTPILLLLLHLGVRRDPKYLRVLMAALLLYCVVYIGQTLLRDVGWRGLSSVDSAKLRNAGGMDQFQALTYSIRLVPESHDYFCTPATPFFITHWVPRHIWPSKPSEPTSQYLSMMWTGGIDWATLNITPSIIGQYHMNWGVFGVMWIGFFMGFMFKAVDLLVRSARFTGHTHLWVLLGMFAAFLIASFRQFSPLYFMFPLFGFIVFVFCTVRAHPKNQ